MNESRAPGASTLLAPRAGSATAQAARPFICFCGQDWWYHNRAHSDFQLMTRIARTRPVLLVNSIGMRMPIPGRSTKSAGRIWRKALSIARLLRQPLPDVPGFHVMTPLMIPLYGSPFVRRVSAELVRAQVTTAAGWLGIDDPVIFVTVPTAWDVVKGMKRTALIFNRSDKHSAFREADTGYIAGLEEELLRGSDLVLYVNRNLMAAERPLAGARAHYLDHGVDLEHFRRTPPEAEPADLRAIPRPRVGFFGALDDYTVDFGLLERLARALPDVSLVLVGAATCSLKRLTDLANVSWLGPRPYAEIPRYGSGFDVALMPWLQNEWISNCNPIKLKEYLALGLPVVTTPFPEVDRYRELVHVAGTPDEFVAQVRRALAPDAGEPERRERRVASVARDSWDQRTRELLALAGRIAR
jgi:glycosyltransferase involved in cell wall biosynthesis